MAEEIDTMLQDAIEALRWGERARAKDILTRLIKANQKEPTYWVWMSAVVDTTKERIYCLKTALTLDPDNGSAQRGLRLFGALPPAENVPPFPMNRRRAWQEKLLLEHEIPHERGLRVAMSSPLARLAMIVLAGAALVGAAVYGFGHWRPAILRQSIFWTAGPSPTYTLTPTFVNAPTLATPVRGKPTPLAQLAGVFYTPTPLYNETPRPPESQDIFRAARAAYQQGNWAEFIREMQQIQKIEPQAADVAYYIGEGYRAEGDCRTALDYYNNSLKINSAFAPGYVGLARARVCIEPGADTSALYDLALRADPQYGEAYLDRATFNLAHKNAKAALPDIQQASRLMPESALVQLAFAQAYLLQDNNAKALAAAQKANSIDLTLLPSYYYLGGAYIANAQYADAIKPLQTYLIYAPEDGAGYALLGEAYTETGDYRAAIDALGRAVQYDPNQVQAYTYLGTSYLKLDNLAGAQINFEKAISFFPDSFDANIGMTQIYYQRGTFGSAYLQAETSKAKAKNNTQLALAIYWRALSQEGRQSYADAIKDWKTLLAMSPTDMTPDMRQTAQDHLKQLSLPAVSRPTATGPTPAPTARPGNTATPAPKTLTPIVTVTPAATKTP